MIFPLKKIKVSYLQRIEIRNSNASHQTRIDAAPGYNYTCLTTDRIANRDKMKVYLRFEGIYRKFFAKNQGTLMIKLRFKQ